MKGKIILLLVLFGSFELVHSQTEPFENIDFILGNWTGTGSGFGNSTSRIESSFQPVMGGQYIEVTNESWFEPTESDPEGEHHIDRGFMSFDNARKTIVFRQFNNEGYINQYLLNDALSNDTLLVFDTEMIENFVPGGRARWRSANSSLIR